MTYISSNLLNDMFVSLQLLTCQLLSGSCPLHLGTDPHWWRQLPPQWVQGAWGGLQGLGSSSHSIPPPQSPPWGLWPPGLAVGRPTPSRRSANDPDAEECLMSPCHLSGFRVDFEFAQNLHVLPCVPYRTSFHVSHYPSLPSHPAARLWGGAGLASLSITEARWVTSARIDSLLWWDSTLGHWCICKQTLERKTQITLQPGDGPI